MKISDYSAAKGSESCELIGGPFDKMAINFDNPPTTIIFDGHRYESEMKVYDEPGNFDIVYRYKQS